MKTLLLLSGLALAFIPGCRRTGDVTTVRTYVGYVENSDAFVALMRADARVVAYVCDGRSTVEWLLGEADGRRFDAMAEGARLQAVFERNAVVGTFTSAQGGVYRFTARPAAGTAGLYRATDTFAGIAYVGGWIVLSDGQQRGAVKRAGAILQEVGMDPSRPGIQLPDGKVLVAHPAERMLAAMPGR